MKHCHQCGKELTRKQNKFCSVQCACQYNNAHRPKKIIKRHCEQCGIEFEALKSSQRFCSRECAYRNRCKEIPEKHCVICGKTFNVDRRHASRNTCSIKCRGKLISQRRKGVPILKKRTLPDKVEKHCIACGHLFIIDPHLSIRNTCSKKCRYKYISQTYRRENHKLWKGGKDYDYGPSWKKIAAKIRKRDNYTCQICDLRHKGRPALHVHHVVPLREFDGDYEKANQPSNLITLCLDCHSKQHQSAID